MLVLLKEQKFFSFDVSSIELRDKSLLTFFLLDEEGRFIDFLSSYKLTSFYKINKYLAGVSPQLIYNNKSSFF